MLVLTRVKGQRIQIGDSITIKVLSGAGRIGIEAPRHVRVRRGELLDANSQSADGREVSVSGSTQGPRLRSPFNVDLGGRSIAAGVVMFAAVCLACFGGPVVAGAHIAKESNSMGSIQLRLHGGCAVTESLVEESTPSLSEVFERHIRPELTGREARANAKNYEIAIAKFTAFLEFGGTTTSSPANPEFTDLLVFQWQQKELENGLAASTINVNWKYLRAVLRRMGPRGTGNPKGLGLIDSVPHLDNLPVPRPRPKVVPLETLDALYLHGAPDMSWPLPLAGGVSGALLWRTWLVCAYNLAMRTRDLLTLRWENIHWDPQSLDPDSTNESPHGWVEWVPAKTARKKPEPLVLPLSACVRAHLEAIRHDEHPCIFGRQMSRVSDRKLYGQKGRPGEWPRLIELAATHVPGGIKPFEIRSIRRTANTQYNRLDRKLGSHVLGHAKRDVNDMYYQQWEADLIEYVQQLPQPSSFTTSKPSNPPRQFLMF